MYMDESEGQEDTNSMVVCLWGDMWCVFNTSGAREWHTSIKGIEDCSGTVEPGKQMKLTLSTKPSPYLKPLPPSRSPGRAATELIAYLSHPFWAPAHYQGYH